MVKGIALYTVELDGCLNGVYSDNFSKGVIYNEIAKTRGEPNSDLSGDYSSVYFEKVTEEWQPRRIDAELKIKLKGKTYSFEWKVAQKLQYKGTGYRINERQIAVSWHEVK